jgi:hypothetical protein
MNKKQHMRSVVALLLLAMITPCLTWAQKKELSQARTYIKSGKDFDKAERLMTDLLKKDSASRDNKKVYLMWLEAVQKQYAQANERLYLKQKQDTAAFFDLTRRMFIIAETLDSLDMRPDKKGRVNLEYRQKHAELLSGYRVNLYNGGSFFVRKANYNQAFTYYEDYINSSKQPLFSAYHYEESDSRLPEASYWAVYSGYIMKDPVLTLRYRKLALRDSSKAAFTLMYIAEARRWMKDSELYLATLEEGFRRYPTFHYFFPRLMDEYSRIGQMEKALATADSALSVNDSNKLFLFAKSTVLLRMERWADCITYSERLIQLCDTLPEPYFNAGTAYLNLAEKLEEKKDKKLRRQAFQRSQAYMERYRQLAPEEKGKWAPALYRIYLNLNLGKQFDEIDRLLRKTP